MSYSGNQTQTSEGGAFPIPLEFGQTGVVYNSKLCF